MQDFGFELIYYRHNKYSPAPPVVKSQILFNDLTVLFDGAMTYKSDRETFSLSAGDAIMLPQNSVRERVPIAAPMDYVSFNFVTEEPVDFPIVIKNAVGADIKLLIVALDELNRGKAFFDKYSSSLILTNILHCLRQRLQKSNENPTVSVIEKYLLDNYKNKVTLNDIAEATYFSAAYCDELFKKTKGKYIIDYLIDIRISEAQRLLIEGIPLSVVAEKTGFNDYNYFSRLFKKRTGYSPKAYQSMVIKK